MLVRMLFPTLQELKDAGYLVEVVMNPSYIRSAAEAINADGCRFSLIHKQEFRYGFSESNAKFSVDGFESKLQAYLDEYGASWGYRLDPVVAGEAA